MEKMDLSLCQMRFWLESKIHENSSAYNLNFVYSIRGKLNIPALQKAINDLINSHECFQTYFTEEGDNIRQCFFGRIDAKISQNDLSKNKSNREQLTKNFIDLICNQPFNLSNPPLFRFGLSRQTAQHHILAMSFHHIIADGLTLTQIVRLLSEYYTANIKQLGLIDDSIPQLSDYVEYEKKTYTAEHKKTDLSYWLNSLNESSLTINLPIQRKSISPNGTYIYFRLPQKTFKRFNKILEQESTTAYRAIALVFSVLLARYSNQDEIILSCPVNIRPKEYRNTLGCFVNNLPLKIQLSKDATFKSLIQQMNERRRLDKKHQKFSFTDIVAELRQQHLINQFGLLNVCLVETDLRTTALALDNLSVSAKRAESNTCIYDICLEYQIKETLEFRINYKNEVFEEWFIQNFIKSFRLLLSQFIENTGQQVNHIPLLSKADEITIVKEWNQWNPYSSIHDGLTLHQAFEKLAEKFPNNIALVFENQNFTYRELNQKANQLARELLSYTKNSRKNQLIGLSVERSPIMIIGILAILKSGAGYLALDPLYPEKRLKFIQDDAGIEVALVQESLYQSINSLFNQNVTLICIESILNSKIHSDENIVTSYNPNSVAYVIYTSGTTGNPKGALIYHRNVIALFAAAQQHFKFNQHDTWTLFHSYGFDFSVWEIWGAFLYGGRLVCVPYFTARNPEALCQLIVEQQITVFNQTPSAFQPLNQLLFDKYLEPNKPSLRYIIFGGEMLNVMQMKHWLQNTSETRPQLVNMYGVTEATILSSYCPIDSSFFESSFIGSPIGIRLQHSSFFVLDENLQPVPVGVTGELYISGHGLGGGYLNRQALTKERFIRNPFFTEDKKGSNISEYLYKTGDLVCWQLNGQLEYIGRRDHQVKIRGHRVELEEIQSLLKEHQHIKDAIITVYHPNQDEKALAAYFIPTVALDGDNAQMELTAQIHEYLSQELPGYMLPSIYIPVTSFPLNQSGKLDHRALPDPLTQFLGIENLSLPRNPVETALLDIWQKFLPMRQIGIYDNFFHIGGNSLLAIQIISIAKNKDLYFTVEQFFENPTVASLASKITSSPAKKEYSEEMDFAYSLYGDINF